MHSGAVWWALAHLNNLTWFVADYRVWLVILATIIGLAAPLLGAARKHGIKPQPVLVIRGGAMALAFSAGAVTLCSLLHFSDLRWLVPSQRTTTHLSAAGGLFSFTKPIVAVVNSVAGVPAEIRATQVAVHTAVGYAFLAMAAFFVVAITWRRARRADIRQLVREEILRSGAYVRES
jgi:hypothetical protein